MARPQLTVHEARSMDFEELIARVESIMKPYEAPGGDTPESMDEWKQRVSRTLDEMPDIYRWFLSCEAHFDHWTDAMNDQWGTKAIEYRSMRQRRDLFRNMASAAKKRYDGASRLVTVEQNERERMPQGRKV